MTNVDTVNVPQTPYLTVIICHFSKYGQIYTAPLYSNEWIMFTDGREYHHEDALGDPVVATAIDTGDQLKIVALGGKAGPMKTIMSWENKRLKMELTLIDQDNVTAVRYFQPV